jgi:hypothetical protein
VRTIANNRRDDPVRIYPANAPVFCVSYVEVAVSIDRDPNDIPERGVDGRSAIAAKTLAAVAGNQDRG